MSRIAHILREFWRNLGRHAGTTVASLLSLTLLFLLFDLFWVAAGTADRFYRDLMSEIEVEAFVAETYPDSTISELSNSLVTVEGIFDFEYLTRDMARQRLAAMVGTDLLVGYEDSNPLPRSYRIQVDPTYVNLADLMRLESDLFAIEGIGEVHYSRDWLYKAEQAKAIILKIGLVLGVLIFGAALISSANSIRLATLARAVGFRRMLLQGAGKIFIALPFIIESFLISGLAAAIGWGLILYSRTQVSLAQLEIVYPTTDQIIIYCVAVSFLGAISGYLGLRKQLKV